MKVSKMLECKNCLFCKHYCTAYGRCKGQIEEICGNYYDIDKKTFWEGIKELLDKITGLSSEQA
jgi:hypothetical protein